MFLKALGDFVPASALSAAMKAAAVPLPPVASGQLPVSSGPRDEGLEELRGWLRRHRGSGLLLQDVISSPLLIGGHKFSLRLYALITSAEPLRVYLHEDGFALFASRPYNASDAADPRSFLTNAYQNRRSPSAVVGDGDGGGGAESAAGTGAPTTARMLEADRRVARELGLQLPPRSCRWTLAQLLKFVAARQVNGGGGDRSSAADNSSLVGSSAAAALRRALERVVLHTFVAARPRLADETAQSLTRLGLSGSHEYAATFELAAFDVMLDAHLKAWLLEVNTSPSLKVESAEGAAMPGGKLSADLGVDLAEGVGGEGNADAPDLPIKQRVVADMLALADATPEASTGPEAALRERMQANMGTLTDGTLTESCGRRWRLGGCRHCPRWADVGELWRAALERRRAGGFVPLMPSLDTEWTKLAGVTKLAGGTKSRDSEVHVDRPVRAEALAGRVAAAAQHRPRAHELLAAWLRAPGESAEDKWEAMLCSADESKSKTKSKSSRLSNIDFSGMD